MQRHPRWLEATAVNRNAFLPRLSIYDPAEASEGTIDPLGLALLAGRLADKLVPGFTERSRRPRFLTALAVGARILSREGYPDGVYGDHPDGPANIAFERLVLESFAHRSAKGEEGLLGVPGIGKARAAAGSGARLSSNLYLKAPGAVGLWVAYKRLARDVEILDDDGHLLENGVELLEAWEQGIGKKGCVTGAGNDTHALLATIDEALRPLLGEGNGRNPQSVWAFIYENLRPEAITKPERDLIRAFMVERDPTRRAVFFAVHEVTRTDPGILEAGDPEYALLCRLPSRVESGIRQLLETILAYEHVVVLLRRAFLSILYAGGRRGDGRVDAKMVGADPEVGDIFRGVREGLAAPLDQALELLEASGMGGLGPETLAWARGAALESVEELFEALIGRHIQTQRGKPPDGRRPWLEGEGGNYFVRARYVEAEPPPEIPRFHPYHLRAVLSFLGDLQGLAR